MEKLIVNPAETSVILSPRLVHSRINCAKNLDDAERYQQLSHQQETAWENKCTRCGACCGAYDGDPCVHLKQGEDKKYFCSIYANRFGPQKTVKGNTINCVPIRQILHTSWPGDHCCGYKK